MANNGPPLRIAVIGGDVAAHLVYHALLSLDKFDLVRYDAQAVYDESRFDVLLSSYTMNCLSHVDPQLVDRVKAAGGQECDIPILLAGSGPDAGKQFSISASSQDSNRPLQIQQSDLRALLLDGKPTDERRADMKLQSIESEGKRHRLIFSEGLSDVVDLVVSTDAAQIPRQFVRGQGSRESAASRWYRSVTKVPAENFQSIWKADLPVALASKPCNWVGKGVCLSHGILPDPDDVEVVTCFNIDHGPETDLRLSRAEIRDRFAAFDHAIPRSIIDLICKQSEDARSFSGCTHVPLDSKLLVRDGVCLVSAEADSPPVWQEGDMTALVEDIAVLQEILDRIYPHVEEDVSRGLQAYDLVRRPRVLEISRTAAEAEDVIFNGVDEASVEEIQQNLNRLLTVLVDFDIDQNLMEAADMVQVLFYRSVGIQAEP